MTSATIASLAAPLAAAAPIVPGADAGALSVSPVGVLLFLAIGVGLIALVRWLSRLARRARLPAATRARLQTALMIAELTAAVIYVAAAAPLLFSGPAVDSPYYALIVAAAALWIGWIAGRDVLHGVVFRAARTCGVGDLVRVGDLRGRVARLGYRFIVLVTHDDEEVFVPYGRFGRDAVVREPAAVSATRHTFTLTPPAGVSLGEARAVACLAAFNHHWASVGHEARVEPLTSDDGRAGAGPALEVGVYALDAVRGPEIEAAVRAAVDGLAPTRG